MKDRKYFLRDILAQSKLQYKVILRILFLQESYTQVISNKKKISEKPLTSTSSELGVESCSHSSVVSKHFADNIGFSNVPLIVADRAPSTLVEHFYVSFSRIPTTYQADRSIRICR